MTVIGFVGLGSMGAPLAGRLLSDNRVYGTESGVPLRAATAADSALSTAEDLGYGDRDIAGPFQLLSTTATGTTTTPA